MPGIAATLAPHCIAAPRAKRTRIPLSGVAGRSRIGRRIAELRQVFTAAFIEVHGEKAADALALARIESAAVMTASAEAARARFLSGQLSADDLVRLENRAARAERALALGQSKAAPAPPSLDAYLAAKGRSLA